MAESNEAGGWRAWKDSSGIEMEISSGETVSRGVSMPHSPRWRERRLWVLNSGYGALETVDISAGSRTVVESFPSYNRGLAFCGSFAFIGLSRIRETAVFSGLPIAANCGKLKCGLGVVDLRSGRMVATLEFDTGVEEIFDVQIFHETVCPAICGPCPAQDIWLVPRTE